MKPRLSAACYVGRIGGLAVALGIGAAVSLGHGVAWAEPSSSGGSSPGSSQSTGSTGSDGSGSTSSRGGTGARADDSAPSRTARSTENDAAGPLRATATQPGAAERRTATRRAVAAPARSSDETATTKAPATQRVVVPTTAGDAVATEAVSPARAVSTTTSIGSTALAGVATAPPSEPAPAEPAAPSPVTLALAAWSSRRDTQRTATTSETTTTQARTIAPTAAALTAVPTALASVPLGWVTGRNNARYLDGHPVPQTNDTVAEFNIAGTDLGIMWDGGTIDGERFVHVAFGDTFSQRGMTGDWRNNVLLISFDTDFYRGGSGARPGLELAPTGTAYQFIDRSTTELSFLFPNEVTVIPTSGIRVGGSQYVNYMSVRSWDTPGRWTTNYSAISTFVPGSDGGDWVIVPSTIRSAGWFRSSTPYVAGDQNFQQAAYVLQPEDQVGEDGVRYLYAFGTPSGRAGSAYLSRVPEGAITDLSQYEYWDGSTWVVGRPAVAVPVIGDSPRDTSIFGPIVDFANDPNVLGGYLGGLVGAKTGGNVSEMSVQYNEYLDKYVVLYGDGNNDIQLRTADTPEGPWSEPITIARSADYPGLYAPMIHPWSGTGLLTGEDGKPDVSTLYWNMSLWGDYNVVLMETDLSPLDARRV